MNNTDFAIKYEYVFHHERPIPAASVQNLFAFENWWPNRKLEDVETILDQNYAVGAWHDEKLVGFSRVISDGYFHAYLEEVIVHPDYRRQGIGFGLISHLMGALTNVETVSLFCKPRLLDFYERCGFEHFPKQQMLHRNIKA